MFFENFNNKFFYSGKMCWFLPFGCKLKIRGKNNTIILGKNCIFRNSRIKIKGNDNTITIGNETKLYKTNIDIIGNNNKINISNNIKFQNTIINELGDSKVFIISTTKHPIRDAKFYIEEGGTAIIGKNSELKNGGLRVVVNNGYKTKPKLLIGDDVYVATDCIIRASDGHTILDENNNAINEPKDVIIGNNVWIMSRCTILKGSFIPSGCGIAANSLVNKAFNEEHILLGGIPAKILRHNFKWDPRTYNQYMSDSVRNKVAKHV